MIPHNYKNASDDLKIKLYKLSKVALHIQKGTSRREWMDQTPEKFVYRCLPLTIANATGWEFISPIDFSVTWRGGDGIDQLTVDSNLPQSFASSHFGSGILTIHPGWLLQTPKGWSVMVKGRANDYKESIIPLEGVVETDWLPFTFTMNWKMTKPTTVHFRKGDVLCSFHPFQNEAYDQFKTELHIINENPELRSKYEEWAKSRQEFNANPDRKAGEWQKHYMRGVDQTSKEKIDGHVKKRNMKKFTTVNYT